MATTTTPGTMVLVQDDQAYGDFAKEKIGRVGRVVYTYADGQVMVEFIEVKVIDPATIIKTLDNPKYTGDCHICGETHK